MKHSYLPIERHADTQKGPRAAARFAPYTFRVSYPLLLRIVGPYLKNTHGIGIMAWERDESAVACYSVSTSATYHGNEAQQTRRPAHA